MPHSPNLRFTSDGRAAHLNSKGAKKFDEARSKALEKGKKGKRFTGLGAVHLKPSEYKDKELIRHTKKIMEKYNH
jgi:hypothetical protein